MIEGITLADGGLAEVATDLAERFFPGLADGWRVGAVVHQPVQESRRLFADGWLCGRLDVLELPGVKGGFLCATVGPECEDTIKAHGVAVNFAGYCEAVHGVVLVGLRRFDLRGDMLRAVLIHEFAHGAAVLLPPHGPAWRSRLRRAARQARKSGALALAAMLDADAERYAVQERGGPDPAHVGAYLDAFYRQSEENRRRVQGKSRLRAG